MLSSLEWAQFCSFPVSAVLGVIVHSAVIYRLHHYNVQLNKYHIFVISQSINDILFTMVDLSTLQVRSPSLMIHAKREHRDLYCVHVI